MTVDQIQDRKIMYLIGGMAALGGLTAFLIYIDRKRNNKVRQEILQLDKNIKELQLQKLKKGA
jgi:hypothetical protein